MSLESTHGAPMAAQIERELAALEPAELTRLEHAGFDRARLARLAANLDIGGDASARRDARNRVPGEVHVPGPGDILTAPAAGTAEERELAAEGEAAMRRGELAFCVMAGGMATRMGGVVKALVEAFDGHTFLQLRLGENAAACARAGCTVPLWLMTSDATDALIKKALAESGAPAHVQTFMQDLGVRLTPDGHVFRGADGKPSSHATGHGDLPDALRRSGLLARFHAAGGKCVWIANLDNLGASIDPAILGAFIRAQKDVMVEVCDKAKGDRGGIPVHALGRLQVLEEFRLPAGFDATQVTVFNTNTFLVRAEPLEKAPIDWTFFEVEKKVEGRPAIQFERLLQELTAYLPSTYIRVPREGARSRFLPVKDDAELAARRADIAAVARARGMLPGA